jgi:hypothetical protein
VLQERYNEVVNKITLLFPTFSSFYFSYKHHLKTEAKENLVEESEDVGLVSGAILEFGGGTDEEISEATTLEGDEVVHVLDGHTTICITKCLR